MRKKLLVTGAVVMLLCMLLFSACGAKIDKNSYIFENSQTETVALSLDGEAEALVEYGDTAEYSTVKLSAAPADGGNQNKNEESEPEKEVDLLWVEIVLSVVCITVTIINAVYAHKHPKPAKKYKNENINSISPVIIPVIMTIFTPLSIIPAIIILGVMTLASCGVLVGQVVANSKRRDEEEEDYIKPREAEGDNPRILGYTVASKEENEDEESIEEIAELAEEISEIAEEATDETDVFTEAVSENDDGVEEHKYISPENIVILDEDEEQKGENEENAQSPIIALSAEEESELAADDDSDDDTDDDGSSEKNIFSDHGLRIYVSYNFSFEAKLRMATSGLRHMYHVLSEYLKSFKLGYRRSWKGERYYLKGKTYARLMFRGKTLCVCLAIDPKSLEGSKYRYEDVSGVKKYAAVPCMIRLRNGRAFKNSLELIQMMMASAEIPQAYTPEDSFVATQPESREALIELGLIKVLATDDHGDYLGSEEEIKSGKIDLSSGGMPLMHEISAEEAHKISDTTAESFIHIEVEQAEEPEGGKRKGIVNIDTISAAFEDGETVTLEELKNRGLIPKNTTFVKVLARGLLNKSLTVKAHDFSLDAIKMIIIAGGDAIELKNG